MLVKGLQWWAMGLNPHNCTRSTGATIIPLLQKIYPNHGIISSDFFFNLEVYNFEKKCVHHDFTPNDNSSKSSTAGGSQVLNSWSFFWFLLLQLHLTGKPDTLGYRLTRQWHGRTLGWENCRTTHGDAYLLICIDVSQIWTYGPAVEHQHSKWDVCR